MKMPTDYLKTLFLIYRLLWIYCHYFSHEASYKLNTNHTNYSGCQWENENVFLNHHDVCDLLYFTRKLLPGSYKRAAAPLWHSQHCLQRDETHQHHTLNKRPAPAEKWTLVNAPRVSFIWRVCLNVSFGVIV